MTYYRPAGLPDPAWEIQRDARNLISNTLDKIDRDRQACGLPTLLDADLTIEQRTNGIKAVLSGPQDADTVAAAGAQLTALLAWMIRAEHSRPELGTAA